MAKTESFIWESHPSQLINIPQYVLILFLAFSWLLFADQIQNISFFSIYLNQVVLIYSLVMCLFLFVPYVKTKTTKYKLSSERLFIYSGVFSLKREEIELYRIKDYQIVSPLCLRIFGLSNIQLITSDRNLTLVVLKGLKKGEELCDKIRLLVETNRFNKGVREID